MKKIDERASFATFITIDGVTYPADKLAVLYMTGIYPDRVEHLDGDVFNNAWANLRAFDKHGNKIEQDNE
jgi:hypothetical protein